MKPFDLIPKQVLLMKLSLHMRAGEIQKILGRQCAVFINNQVQKLKINERKQSWNFALIGIVE